MGQEKRAVPAEAERLNPPFLHLSVLLGASAGSGSPSWGELCPLLSPETQRPSLPETPPWMHPGVGCHPSEHPQPSQEDTALPSRTPPLAPLGLKPPLATLQHCACPHGHGLLENCPSLRAAALETFRSVWVRFCFSSVCMVLLEHHRRSWVLAHIMGRCTSCVSPQASRKPWIPLVTSLPPPKRFSVSHTSSHWTPGWGIVGHFPAFLSLLPCHLLPQKPLLNSCDLSPCSPVLLAHGHCP